MDRQVKIQESFLQTHRDFMENLQKSLDVLEKDIREAREMQSICTDEWCYATESYLDELYKMIYSVSEPRWLDDADSKKIRELRQRIHDLYAAYKQAA